MATRTIPDAVVAGIIERLRDAEPGLEAVLLCGSFARNSGSEFSDVDIVALIDGEPERSGRTWFEVTALGEQFHVTVGVESLDSYEADEPEAAAWALGFPTTDAMRVLWATPSARAVLGDDPSEVTPAAEPELEDFVELYMKVLRGSREGDTVLLRWAARTLAEHSAGLVRPFNAPVQVATAPEAIAAACSFGNCPAHHAVDFSVCWGLVPASDEAVIAAASRMQQELLDWLRVQLDGQAFEPDDARALLLDGSLQAYLAR